MAFQKRYDEFRKLNTELIGLSVDQVFVHIKWEEWIKEKLGVEIQFPIIADTGKIAEILGLIHPGKGTNTVRAVFFVDPAGYIRAMLFYPQELGRNFDDFLLMIKGFQLSDSQQVAIPANWPNNELVGDRVIVPPAQDVDTAAKRLEETIATTGGFVTRLRRTRNEEPRRSTFGLLHPGINVIGAQVDSF